jgi:hypothetical protein
MLPTDPTSSRRYSASSTLCMGSAFGKASPTFQSVIFEFETSTGKSSSPKCQTDCPPPESGSTSESPISSFPRSTLKAAEIPPRFDQQLHPISTGVPRTTFPTSDGWHGLVSAYFDPDAQVSNQDNIWSTPVDGIPPSCTHREDPGSDPFLPLCRSRGCLGNDIWPAWCRPVSSK